jgi:hypothetical protein
MISFLQASHVNPLVRQANDKVLTTKKIEVTFLPTSVRFYSTIILDMYFLKMCQTLKAMMVAILG